jgi:hypothetical protein
MHKQQNIQPFKTKKILKHAKSYINFMDIVLSDISHFQWAVSFYLYKVSKIAKVIEAENEMVVISS